MIRTPYNILFVCSGNSARSIMAESLARYWGAERFRAYSAGSHPAGEVNPLALELLERFNMPTKGLRSKSLQEFMHEDAPRFDFIITLCEDARKNMHSVWPTHPMSSHWGVPDPCAVADGSLEVDKIMAFREAFRILENRIKLFTSLRIEGLEHLRLQAEMDKIGRQMPAAAVADEI